MKKIDLETMSKMSTKELIDTLFVRQVSDYVPGKGEVYRDKIFVRPPLGVSKADIGAVMQTRKQECIDYLTAKREEKRKREEERQAKIDAIPGLKEIKNAIMELNQWYAEFNRSFEGEYAVGGMGVGPKPDYDIEAMRAQYPIAAAYMKAEAEADKSNYELSAIGKKALDAIIEDPEHYVDALEQMNAEIKEFTNRHLWD